jgi:hypothetical protein
MDRADDARKRLAALHQPIPRPTKRAVAQNRAEIASRGESTIVQRMSGLIKKGPDVARAAQVGEPDLVEPEPISATTVVRQETMGAMGGGEKSVGVEVVKPDQPASNDLAPAADATSLAQPPFGKAGGPAATTTSDPNELKPTAPADSNELTPSGGDQPLPAPPQVNEIQQGQSSSQDAAKNNDDNTPASDAELSSSKKKKKSGLKKIVPF